IFHELQLKHKIFFARKANKCIDFPKVASKLGEGADTASYHELEQCLEIGIEPKDLILTAAVKNQTLLELAVDNQVTIVLDNIDEWELLRQIIKRKKKMVNINVRIGGFYFGGDIMHSRFGFSPDEAFKFINNMSIEEPFAHFSGLHFHLNGYSIEQRAAAIDQSLQLIDRLRKQNIITASLDIGGGFLMNYLSNKSEWENFNRELRRAVLGERTPLTYQ